MKKFDDIFGRVDTMHERDSDRQTDRRTDNGRQQRSRLHRAARGKKATFVNASCEKPQFIVDGRLLLLMTQI